MMKYYTICVDMRKEKVYVLDNQNESIEHCQAAKYLSAAELLKNMLADYMAHKHHIHRSNVVKRTKLTVVNIKWGDAKNINDTGVYMMRHMETFMGEATSLWACGLAPKLRKQLNLLRVRYCATLVMWDKNSIHEAMESSAKLDFESLVKVENSNLDITLLGK
ncbi:uncharacterized protein LOC131015725 [Salvia miltiorrhiza]|uniref:uncharacterized protein LOC131015725 n=1 Tax=Salvia miltiorrhiza TaxID=226208 RepID=UPI0025AC6F8A|nr:uncharacterized protein LOC131015725 [Salvia miltiorrhiza]